MWIAFACLSDFERIAKAIHILHVTTFNPVKCLRGTKGHEVIKLAC